MPSVVIIHITDASLIPAEYVVVGDDVQVFVVDENCPGDRVYELTNRSPIERARELIPEGSEVGSSQDARHKSIEAKVNALFDGRPMLAAVPKVEAPADA